MKNIILGFLVFGSISAYSSDIDLRTFEKCSNTNFISLRPEYQGTYLADSGKMITLNAEGLKTFNPGFNLELYSNMCVHQKIVGSRLVVELTTSENFFRDGGFKQKIVVKLREGSVKLGHKRYLKAGFMKSGMSIQGGDRMRFTDLQKVN